MTFYRTPTSEDEIQSTYSNWLRQWPINKQEHHIDTHCGPTFVVSCGSAENPPLILLHPPALNNVFWINDVETYCKSHRVFAVDLPGQPGRSGEQAPADAAEWVQWLEEVIRGLQLQLKQVVLLGVSSSAWLAVHYAARHPEQVSRLALISPLGIVKRKLGFSLLPNVFFPFKQGWRLKKMFADPELDKRARAFVGAVARHCKLPKLRAKKISADVLRQLYCPVLVLAGGRDKVQKSEAMLLRLIKSVPQLEIIYRKNGGHVLGSFSREIDRFLLTQYVPD